MRIEVGTKLKWNSAAGILTGTVKNIKLDKNGAGETIPWMLIEDIVGPNGKMGGACLPAFDSYFKMMELEVV